MSDAPPAPRGQGKQYKKREWDGPITKRRARPKLLKPRAKTLFEALLPKREEAAKKKKPAPIEISDSSSSESSSSLDNLPSVNSRK